MANYTLKRFGMSIVTLFIIACLTFLLMNSIPGSPWLSEKSPSQATIDMLNEKYGMDKPVIVQLGMYLENLLKGDMGVSLKMQKNRPVIDIILEMFPVSAQIGFFAILWAIIVGIPLGCIAAYNRGNWIDSLLRIVCTIGISMPSFVVASLLLTTFAGSNEALRIFPTIFNSSLGIKAYILPCFALGLYPMCYTARQARSS
ncbi:MAG: ABC transporter permease, partial [Candidatus Moranbacteria bacterium]|nr:ABC transporter permease [Candidatus Moranbacteria bacterium]